MNVLLIYTEALHGNVCHADSYLSSAHLLDWQGNRGVLIARAVAVMMCCFSRGCSPEREQPNPTAQAVPTLEAYRKPCPGQHRLDLGEHLFY
jgi:hypothetical protein